MCHGDLKAENVLVTSWHWVYLADFASYKPVRLPADNPVSTHFPFRHARASLSIHFSATQADVPFAFDNGDLRFCYLSPERF